MECHVQGTPNATPRNVEVEFAEDCQSKPAASAIASAILMPAFWDVVWDGPTGKNATSTCTATVANVEGENLKNASVETKGNPALETDNAKVRNVGIESVNENKE